jgi:shikimate 5-dehydrogenase
MRFIALFCQNPELRDALVNMGDKDFSFFAVPQNKPLKAILDSLSVLEFAGGLVLEEAQQHACFLQMQRSSLDAQESGGVDTITITPAGFFGDYALGHAVGALLKANEYDAREAKAVVMGSSSEAIAVARELSSLGVSQLALVAESRPEAEKTLPSVAASTVAVARAVAEPTVPGLIEGADIVVRVNPKLEIPESLLGPHLTIVDFSPQALSTFRQQAMRVGAKTYSLRDIQSHQLALALSRLLGKPYKADTFLSVLHKQQG